MTTPGQPTLGKPALKVTPGNGGQDLELILLHTGNQGNVRQHVGDMLQYAIHDYNALYQREQIAAGVANPVLMSLSSERTGILGFYGAKYEGVNVPAGSLECEVKPAIRDFGEKTALAIRGATVRLTTQGVDKRLNDFIVNYFSQYGYLR